MPPLATVVEWGDVLQVLWTATAAAVGVVCSFSFALLGAVRAVEMQRDGRLAEAAVYGALAAAATATFLAAVVLGIFAMASK